MADNTYIQEIAKQIRSKFSSSEVPANGADELFNSYALLALSKGTAVTDEDVHDAWAAWATKFNPNDEAIVPFDELTKNVQSTDTPYTKAIQEVAATLPN